MQDDRRRREDMELQSSIIQKIAHDLSLVYAVETQLPPRLQALLQRLDEEQEQRPRERHKRRDARGNDLRAPLLST
jgi:hypothetical protein